MRLVEFEDPGVYVAFKLDLSSATQLSDFVENELDMKPIPKDLMHVTVASFKTGTINESTFPKINFPIEIDIADSFSTFGFFTLPFKGIYNAAYINLENNRELMIARGNILDWMDDCGISTKTPGGRFRARWRGWTPHVSVTFQDTEKNKLPWEGGNMIKVKNFLRGTVDLPISTIKVSDIILTPHDKNWGADLV